MDKHIFKYIKSYEYFLNEGFDLNYFYKKEHIPVEIQNESDKEINKRLNNKKNYPSDVNSDKLKLWYARNIYKKCIYFFTESYDKAFKSNNENDILLAKNLIDYLKGKENLLQRNVELLNHKIDTLIKKNVTIFDYIFDYILSNGRNVQMWKMNYFSTFEDLHELSTKWHKELKASGIITHEDGKVLITYPDGFYWIDLQTNDSEEESDALGHCGRTGRDTLVSLRQKNKFGEIKPAVTMAIDYDDEETPTYGRIDQCKGKQNTKPVEKYHKYIVDFILHYDIDYNLHEYTDFDISDVKNQDLLIRIFNEKPSLINLDKIIFYENENLASLVLEKFSLDKIKSMSNNHYLMTKNLITKEEFVSKFSHELELRDDILYYKFYGDIKDFDFMFEDSRRDSSRDKVENFSWDYFDTTVMTRFSDLYLGDLNNEGIKLIEDKIEIIKNNLTEEEQNEFSEYDNWEEQVKNIDALYDLKYAIELAFSTAQNSANWDQYYNAIVNPILKFAGMKEMINFEGGFLFKFDVNWAIRADKEGASNHRLLENWFSDYEDADGDLVEPEYFKVDEPYYGWNGTINKSDLL